MKRKKPGTGASKQKLLKDGSIPEKTIQAQILSWLKETPLLFWRQNSGTVFLGNRCIKLGEDGLPDIVIIVPPGGSVLGLEVKSANGTLRPAQKVFRGQLEATGGKYEVVRSLVQAQDAVAKKLGEQEWNRLLASVSVPKRFGPN